MPENDQKTSDLVSVVELRHCLDCRFNKNKVVTVKAGRRSTLIECTRKDCDNWKK